MKFMGIAICVDLNVVEYRLDKSSRCGRLISNKEKLTWVEDKNWI